MTLSREMLVQHRYINLPVKNGAPQRRMSFRVGSETVREFEIELADGEPDFWVFADVTAFEGQRLAIEVDGLDSSSDALASIIPGDTIQGAEDLYREKYRPQFHFSSRRGWNNDPNGLVYYRGAYHLFYQHNPYGWKWGNMHWGHAVSEDLVHWQELPEALYPDKLGTMYSGSAVVDRGNTAGLKAGEEDTLVCFYTAAGAHIDPQVPFTQCMAFSNDRGKTWHKYARNPVLAHVAAHNRDPKVIWHGPSKQWIMALYLEKVEEEQHYALYASPDLKGWTHLDDVYLPGSGECPDFVPLPVDGDPGNVKWVFWGADGHYLVGTFDGSAFTPQTPPRRAYCGGGEVRGSAYAAQTWSDVEDGRRIQIAWLQGDVPGMPFNQQMSLPVELTLRSATGGPRLCFSPLPEIETLYGEKQALRDADLDGGPTLLPTGGHDLLDIHAEMDVHKATELEFTLRGIPVVYHVKRQELSCCDRTAPLQAPGGKLRLRMLLDRASLEIFAAGGSVYIPLAVIPEDDEWSCFMSSREGRAVAVAVDVIRLRSIWG
jgi:fructan beta-fructosidase